MDNLGAQEDELTALEAIYGDDCIINREEHCVEAHHVSDDMVRWVANQLEEQFMPGEGMLYNSVEWVRGQEELYQIARQGPAEVHDDDDEEEGEVEELPKQDVPRELKLTDEETAEMIEMSKLIVSGEPFTERKSTFQAHVAPVTRFSQVKAVLGVLLQNNKIRNATHNIMAYRIHVAEKNTFLQDYDDDGEAAAGGRLLHLLQVADARNVVVVVSRWFGGVLLGPSRFTLINNTARVALEGLGYINHSGPGAAGAAGGAGGSKGKKGKK